MGNGAQVDEPSPKPADHAESRFWALLNIGIIVEVSAPDIEGAKKKLIDEKYGCLNINVIDKTTVSSLEWAEIQDIEPIIKAGHN